MRDYSSSFAATCASTRALTSSSTLLIMEAGISSSSFLFCFAAFFSLFAFSWNLLSGEFNHVTDWLLSEWIYSVRRSSKNCFGTIEHFSALFMCWRQ